MDRVILLALLGIPVLVILHVALSLQHLAPGVSMFSEQERPYLRGHWQPLESSMPSRFVTFVRAQGS